MANKCALIVFGERIPKKNESWWRRFDVVIGPSACEPLARTHNISFVDIQTLIDPGSIYEARVMAEALSRTVYPDGTRVTSAYVYKGYELWWIYYQSLYLYFCLPHTQYKRLLTHTREYTRVYMYNAPFQSLFSCYARAYSVAMSFVGDSWIHMPKSLPLGVTLQMLFSLISLPAILAQRKKVLVFTGDKFEQGTDHDFRLRYVYEELRKRGIPFLEVIRSLESTKKVLSHAVFRARPVLYSEAAFFLGRFMCVLGDGHFRAQKEFGPKRFETIQDPDARFMTDVATQYLHTIYDDLWTIRLLTWLFRISGVKAAYVTAANERNMHTVLACKINAIPTVGILHGFASAHYNAYDFMHAFTGEKRLTVDRYGLWSDWWKEYYIQNGNAYAADQLFVSGLMRPLQGNRTEKSVSKRVTTTPIRVLVVSEQLAIPEEIVPYLEMMLRDPGLQVRIGFRNYRDRFELWLKTHRPDILEILGEKGIFRGTITGAMPEADVVVGSHSTGVIEGLFYKKPVILFHTNKWGDYFSLERYEGGVFYAKNPSACVEAIARSSEISDGAIAQLEKRFFGNPHKNGSAWVVDQIEEYLKK